MATFEIIVVVAIIAIVMLLTAIGTFVKGVWENQKSQEKKLDFINKQITGIWRGQDKIENNAAILSSIVDKMHRNLCVEIADKMVNKMYPVNEGEPLDAAFEPDYKLKKDIECKLNGFAAAVLDAECCTEEIVDFWLERICDAAYKYIKQLKIDWDKLSKEQQDEFLKRIIMPNYDSPFQPPFNPTCGITNKKE